MAPHILLPCLAKKSEGEIIGQIIIILFLFKFTVYKGQTVRQIIGAATDSPPSCDGKAIGSRYKIYCIKDNYV